MGGRGELVNGVGRDGDGDGGVGGGVDHVDGVDHM